MNRFTGLKPRVRAVAMSLMILFGVELLVACVPILVATVTVTAVSVATDRRTLGRNLDDNTLEVDLRSEFLLDDKLDATHLSVTAINGIVLLTGEVSNDSQRQYAEKLAKTNSRTLTVVNEIQLAGTTSLTSRTNDSLITTKVKATLVNAPGVKANTVKVVTEAGKVYLLGLVTRSEADAAVAATQTVGGVTHIVKVFEYIK